MKKTGVTGLVYHGATGDTGTHGGGWPSAGLWPALWWRETPAYASALHTRGELKAIEQLGWIHEAQLLTYLRLTGKRVGLVINFNVPVLKEGIRRVINTK